MRAPSLTFRLATLLGMAAAWAAPAQAEWQDVATISSTLGNNAYRLCVGGAGSDLGCPVGAPLLDIPNNRLTVPGDLRVVGNLLVSGSQSFDGVTFANGGVSATGTISATAFAGDGSGITGIDFSANPIDRIISGTASVIAQQAGTVNLTLGGTPGAAYFHPSLGFVGPGVSTTGTISATRVYAGNIGTSGSLVFRDAYGILSGNANIRIDDKGNIGVGVAPPSSPFDYSMEIAGDFTSNRVFTAETWYGNDGGAKWGNDVGISGNGLNNHIEFTTANTERMRIDAAGNIGIGTSNPNAKLEVVGDISATNLRLSGNLYVSGSQVIDGVMFANGGVSATGTITATNFVGNGSGLTGIDFSANPIDRITSGTTQVITRNNTSITLATAGVERMVVGTNGEVAIGSQPVAGVALTTSGTGYFTGNLGIGIATPLNPLHISSSNPSSMAARFVISGDGTQDSYRNFMAAYDDRNNLIWYLGDSNGAGKSVRLGAAGPAGDAYPLELVTSNAIRATITSSGLVGIGTTNPSVPLEVSGTVSATALVISDTQINEAGGFSRIRQFDTSKGLALHFGGAITGANGPYLTMRGATNAATPNLVTLATGVGGYIYVNATSSGMSVNVAAMPSSSLQLGGALRLAYETSSTLNTCDTHRTGAIKYQSGDFSFCRNGTTWESLTTLAGGGTTSDRIVSGTAAVIAQTNGGTVSFTLGGTAGRAYMHTTLGLVTPGVSVTTMAGISSTNGYFSSGNVGIGIAPGINNTNLYIYNDRNTGTASDNASQILESVNRNTSLRLVSHPTQDSIIYFLRGTSQTTTNGGSIKYDNAQNSMQITVSGTEALRIVSSGYVGIGTNAPDSLLHISGTGYFRVGESGATSLYRPTTGSTNLLNINSAIGNALTVRANGRVGIGLIDTAASPTTSLHVSGTIRIAADPGANCNNINTLGAIKYESGDFHICRNGSTWESFTSLSGGGTASDRITSGTAAVIAQTNGGTVSFTLGGTAGRAYMHTTLGLVTPGVSVTTMAGISSTNGYFSGNVGLGTTSTTYRLNIQGDAYQNSSIRMEANRESAGSTSIDMFRSRGTPAAPTALLDGDYMGAMGFSGYDGTTYLAGAQMRAVKVGNATTGQMASRLAFLTRDVSDSVFAERMTIAANGNVGIGITNPGYTFEVSGTSRFNNGPLLVSRSDTVMSLSPNNVFSSIEAFEASNTSNKKPIVLNRWGGLVGIAGIDTPSATLNVNGAIRMSYDSSTTLNTCDANRTGAIKYQSGDFHVCRNGTTWESFTSITGGGGSSGDRITSGTTSVIASTNTSVTINTAGVERMVIGTSGNIGIGQQPYTGVALSVSGSTRIGNVGGYAQYNLIADANSTALDIGTTSLINNTAAAGIRLFRSTNTLGAVGLYILQGNGTASANSYISGNGNSFLNLNTGNVGIRMATPTTPLEVSGTISGTQVATPLLQLMGVSGSAGISLTSAGDNLGNHTATQSLNMGNNSIVSASNISAAGSVQAGNADTVCSSTNDYGKMRYNPATQKMFLCRP